MDFVILVTILFSAPKTPTCISTCWMEKKWMGGWIDEDESGRKLGKKKWSEGSIFSIEMIKIQTSYNYCEGLIWYLLYVKHRIVSDMLYILLQKSQPLVIAIMICS